MEKKSKITAFVLVAILLVSLMAVLLTNGGSSGINGAGRGTTKVLELKNSTAFGVMNNETFDRCVTDADGNLYVIGGTDGAGGVTGPGYDVAYNGGLDVLIVKYAPDLSKVIASTYLGGNKTDLGRDIQIGTNGHVLVLGWTDSTNFPTTAGAYNQTNAKESTFVCELSSDLASLYHSTFLGDGAGMSMVIDAQGDVLISGSTDNPAFPTTDGAYSRQNAGRDDAFIARLSSDLGTLKGCTLLGGSSYDSADDIALDEAGNVYITGGTWYGWDPETRTIHGLVSSGTFGHTYGGSSDGYVAELSSDLGTLRSWALIGGSDYDAPLQLSIAGDGDVLLGGSTHSSDFPVTADAMNSNHRFPIDAFICRLSSDLHTLRYSTFLGLGISYFNALVEDRDGCIYLSSHASSSTSSIFTTSNALASNFGGFNSDGFVTVLDNKLSKIVYASYIGGNYDDLCSLTVGPDGSVYVVGMTESTNFPTLKDEGRMQDGGYWGHSDGFALLFKYS
jgi:hypothetical protein